MNSWTCFLIALLGAALLLLSVRACRNNREIRRLQRKGWRRQTLRQSCQRGYADEDFLRAVAELCMLIFLLASVLAWLSLRAPAA
ncbi:hypothetical protein [Prosthecobacter sp.]|uniref:hypothetical protein n=1 Tax=Prosthecobacter sp. TaxID=1965333 RepID=UPI003784E1BC